MAPPDFRTRPDDAPQWWRNLRDLERLVILASLVFVIITFAFYALASSIKVVDDFAANIITEVASIAFTVLIIDRLNRQEAEHQRNKQLILQMGSPKNGFALEAVRLLWHHELLTGDHLQKENASLSNANLKKAPLNGANLERLLILGANLEEASLIEANLQQAHLDAANLRKASLQRAKLQNASLATSDLRSANLTGSILHSAYLWQTNLPEANLSTADLRGSVLIEANLQHADLHLASLEGADLKDAKLNGANLKYADLRDVKNLTRANFDEMTILPDGTSWTPDVDIDRFTNSTWKPLNLHALIYWQQLGWLSSEDEDE